MSEIKKKLEEIWRDGKCRSPSRILIWSDKQIGYSESEEKDLFWRPGAKPADLKKCGPRK